jgi:hypothetical protein
MLVLHSEILCQQILKEKCTNGHTQEYKCYQPPLSCKNCEQEAKLAEEKRRRDFELQQKREEQKAAHELRLKDLEHKIAVEKQIVQDAHLAQQRSRELWQKEEDLKEARGVAASVKEAASAFFFSSLFSSLTSQPQTTPSSGSSSTSANGAQSVPQHTSPSQRPRTPPGNPATVKKSPPEAEWQRQKDIEGASSATIDAVMDMIGLEDVKRQMLRIKDKVEVTQRQNASIKDERFNIVLLGNPGTGEVERYTFLRKRR